jgi:Spy/CpxP family protein refolding chaperone
MSEERFVAIEGRLTSVEAKVDDLGREMRELHADSKQEMHALHIDAKREMHALHTDAQLEMHALHADARREMHALHADAKQEMHALHDDLRRYMGVLHENTIDNIKALAPDFGPIRREFSAADAKLNDDIDRRLTPIEAALRKRG